MNRYVSEGLLADVLNGKQVLVVTENMRTARIAFQMTREHTPDGLRTSAANGRERIEGAAGGCIRFRSIAADLRGLSADIVFLDLDRYTVGEDRMYELTHLITATSRGGEVIER